MDTVTEFPFPISEDPHVLIPLPDGTHLSARIWRAEGAGPVPVILEYIPYRKRDGTAVRDALGHPYLAGHGYACVRVDTRGNGESEGVMHDEYTETELSDACDVIAWLAAQDWCSCTVGMQGISWGGFNSLQVAMRRPPALKAVITLCSTTDRYADDIHYKGGVMLGENSGWAATALSWFSVPPDPALVGDAWREMWQQRLEATPDLATRWAQHSHRDDYWKHGSVCEDWGAIEAAVLAVGGWHDGYRNTPAALLENLSAPCRAIVGPWNHKYPHIGVPGPQIGFLDEMLRWYDHWLKGAETGVMDDPPYRAWMMESIKPEVSLTTRPGVWVGQEGVADAPMLALHLNGDVLADTAGTVDALTRTEAAHGLSAGEFFPFGFGPGELPSDQRPDDALALCFDSAPLEDEVQILGAPNVRLTLSADQTHAQVVVRLCDLRPDGTSALITMGMLNLRHRSGHDVPVDVAPGATMEIDVPLDQIAYRLPKGHRLRIAIAPSYFPFAFPSPKPVTLRITGGALEVPRRTGAEWSGFGPPRSAPPLVTETLAPRAESKRIITDHGARTITTEITGDDGVYRDTTHGLETGLCVHETFTIPMDDPGAASARFHWTRSKGRGAWQVRTECEVYQRGDGPDFAITSWIKAWEGDTLIFERTWDTRVPRG